MVVLLILYCWLHATALALPLCRALGHHSNASSGAKQSLSCKEICFGSANMCTCSAGDCAIASSFVSYLGPFNKEFRELLMTRDFYGGCIKLNIPVTKDMQVAKFLVDDSEVGEWTLQASSGWHSPAC